MIRFSVFITIIAVFCSSQASPEKSGFDDCSSPSLDSSLFSDTLSQFQDSIEQDTLTVDSLICDTLEDSLGLLQLPLPEPDSSDLHPDSSDQATDYAETNPQSENPGAAVTKKAARKKHSNTVTVNSKPLYPGISKEQDRLAQAMVEQIYCFEWENAEKTARKMQRLEKKDNLPALSYLLLVSMKIMQVQNNEYGDERSLQNLLKDIDKLSSKGLELSIPASSADSVATTNMLIHAGIKGFRATLKMSKNPIESAIEGMGALKLLERQVELDPTIKDAYLGLGIFYCALAKAPALVRAAVSISGRNISLDTGLEYLRLAAYGGHYTHGVAQIYLIQFLSPYYGHLAEEKSRIFKTLQSRYPQNPFYVFLELDEILCFHPQKLTFFSTGERYKQKIRKFSTHNPSLEKYATLVKYQYRMINPLPPEDLEPNQEVDLKEFSFYPVFLQSLREKLLLRNTPTKSGDYQRRVQFIKKKKDQAAKLLETSDMGPGRRGFYNWHLKDALQF